MSEERKYLRKTAKPAVLRSKLLVALASGRDDSFENLRFPAHTTSVLSNLPGSGTYTNTGSTPITTVGWAAVGLTTSTTTETFSSFQGYFQSGAGGTLEGGIYADSSGNPGATALATFNAVTIPGNTNAEYTLTTTSPFTLQASTNYWFVLHDAVSYTWDRDNSTNGTAPTASTGHTFNGYRTSSNSGGTWTTPSGSNWTVQINVVVPEPATFALAGLGFACLVGYGLRRRA